MVIDTAARPNEDELQALADGCDSSQVKFFEGGDKVFGEWF